MNINHIDPPKTHKKLVKKGRFIILCHLKDTPHGEVRVLVRWWDSEKHWEVHVDCVGKEFFFHTTTDIRTWKKITWKRLVREYRREWRAFLGKK